MLNLSINEQKQIIGGGYYCKVYSYSGEYYAKFYGKTKKEAADLAIAHGFGNSSFYVFHFVEA